MNMVAEIARTPATAGLPISAIGGIETWRDAAEFMALGAGTVQVCTAAMVYGFKIVQEMTTGLSDWMDAKGYTSVDQIVGRAVPRVTDWQHLNLDYVVKAHIDQDQVHPVRPLPHRLRGHQPPGDQPTQGRQAALRGDRGGVRRVQSVRGGVPGGGVHHAGADDRGH